MMKDLQSINLDPQARFPHVRPGRDIPSQSEGKQPRERGWITIFDGTRTFYFETWLLTFFFSREIIVCKYIIHYILPSAEWVIGWGDLLRVLRTKNRELCLPLLGVFTVCAILRIWNLFDSWASGSFCLKLKVEESSPSPDHLTTTSRYACVAGGIFSRASSLRRAASEYPETYL